MYRPVHGPSAKLCHMENWSQHQTECTEDTFAFRIFIPKILLLDSRCFPKIYDGSADLFLLDPVLSDKI